MTDELTPDESSFNDARDLLGAYALGALDTNETARVEALLLEDQDARAEVHALQLGASWIMTANAQPGVHVWDAIIREVESGGAHDAASSVVPITRARRRVSTARIRQVAAAVVAVIGIGTGVVAIVDSGTAPNAVEAAARAAAADPSSRTVSLDTADGEPRMDVVVTDRGKGYAITNSLPKLSNDETYQLWTITSSDGAVSAAILGRDPGVRAFLVPDDTHRMSITEEPKGGSPEPTGIVVASAELA